MIDLVGYFCLFIVAYLGDTPGRWLVVRGDSTRIQEETNENSVLFFNMLNI